MPLLVVTGPNMYPLSVSRFTFTFRFNSLGFSTAMTALSSPPLQKPLVIKAESLSSPETDHCKVPVVATLPAIPAVLAATPVYNISTGKQNQLERSEEEK
ncbi:hypothetical protein ElyMa_002369800 [Elysia marginata]|uniref:Uncharacterized protein n=1 Tax=Elysia marginata TaxID=1093978 RepID=A0AAV4GC44_9GAST|nr:hypothetical protein ElyMa_002369800 [Elysia marginata]